MRTSLLFLISLITIQHSLFSTPITSLDKQVSELANHLQTPSTLILSVHSQTDLPEAQRLLTLAVSQEQPTIILIALPESRLDSLAIRRSANQFFKSDFSRHLTYFIKKQDHPYPEFKTLILSPIDPLPIFTSKVFPQELPKF